VTSIFAYKTWSSVNISFIQGDAWRYRFLSSFDSSWHFLQGALIFYLTCIRPEEMRRYWLNPLKDIIFNKFCCWRRPAAIYFNNPSSSSPSIAATQDQTRSLPLKSKTYSCQIKLVIEKTVNGNATIWRSWFWNVSNAVKRRTKRPKYISMFPMKGELGILPELYLSQNNVLLPKEGSFNCL